MTFLSRGTIFFFHSENLILAGDLNFRFSGGRALELLLKQHPEMSLFVKHVADKQPFPLTISCFSVTLR